MLDSAASAMLALRLDGDIAWLTLDRPAKLNAMTRGFWRELAAAAARVESDERIRVAVVCGAGPCFSVGGDVAGFGALGGAADRRAYVDEALGALRAVERCTKPFVAAVHGHALGGGCELTLACDLVVADATATFGMPESQVGLVPGHGVARGLGHLGLHALKLMVLAGEVLDAQEARRVGLVNRVVPAREHVAAAEELARRVARRAPLAVSVGKRMLNRAAPDAHAHAVDAVAFLQGTDDFAEGVAAFRERREPRFEGR